MPALSPCSPYAFSALAVMVAASASDTCAALASWIVPRAAAMDASTDRPALASSIIPCAACTALVPGSVVSAPSWMAISDSFPSWPLVAPVTAPSMAKVCSNVLAWPMAPVIAPPASFTAPPASCAIPIPTAVDMAPPMLDPMPASRPCALPSARSSGLVSAPMDAYRLAISLLIIHRLAVAGRPNRAPPAPLQ